MLLQCAEERSIDIRQLPQQCLDAILVHAYRQGILSREHIKLAASDFTDCGDIVWNMLDLEFAKHKLACLMLLVHLHPDKNSDPRLREIGASFSNRRDLLLKTDKSKYCQDIEYQKKVNAAAWAECAAAREYLRFQSFLHNL